MSTPLNIFAALKFVYTILFFLILTTKVQAQDSAAVSSIPKDTTTLLKKDIGIVSPDSTVKDSVIVAKDSVNTKVKTGVANYLNRRAALESNRFYNLFGKGEFKLEKFSAGERKDWLFYLVLGLLFFLAILRLSYLKYFNNLFRLFFRTTLRQNQVREQLLQSQLSSMLFNLFFFIASGIYLYLLVRYYDMSITTDKWEELGTCIALVAILYMAKFVVLKTTGWVFGVKPAVETYTFIVFLVNKVLGVFLVPFIVLLAFAATGIGKVALTLSLLMILAMFIYRFVRSYLPIQNEIKVSRFHFFLYLCAFEITPLLLIYKVLLKYF